MPINTTQEQDEPFLLLINYFVLAAIEAYFLYFNMNSWVIERYRQST